MPAPRASQTIIVVTGGDPISRDALALLPEGAQVVAADSGVDRALELGLPVHVAVGDFDSVDPAGLRAAAAAGAVIERHPIAKDATDLELALDVALTHHPARIHVLGGHGGRLDHLLGNALLLAAPAYAGVEVVAQMGEALVTVIRSEATLTGAPGDLVTLLAVHGIARRVRTEGLLYPLVGEDLRPGSTRGISNELVADSAHVALDRGVLLAVQPGQPGTHQRTRTRQ
jgi:thiamine pyrophosphokinase